MASGTIKGITIKLGADSSELTTALRSTEASLKSTQTQLNNVNKALKFDPTNVTLLTQKQQLLAQKIQETQTKLSTLRDALAQMDAAGVSHTSEEFMNVEREIQICESQLKNYNQELKQTASQASDLGQLGSQFSELGGKLQNLGRQLTAVSVAAAAVATAISAAAVSAGVWADDLNTLASITGISAQQLQVYSAAADLVDVEVSTIAKSVARMKKNMLTASEGTGDAAKAFGALGITVTDANGSLRDQDSVFQEVLKNLGMMENETERDAIAMQIFGRSAAQLNPLIEDMGQTYVDVVAYMSEHKVPIVDQETLDQANRFNDAIDNIKMVWQQAIMVIGSKLAGFLAPAMETIADKLSAVAGWIANLNPKILAIVGGLASLLAVVAPLLLAVGGIMKVVGGILPQLQGILTFLKPITSALSPIIAFCTANPIVLVVAALVALSAGLTATGTSVDEFVGKITTFVTSALNSLIASLPQVVAVAGQMVTSLVEGIVNNLPLIIETALNLVITLAQALIDNLPLIIEAAFATIDALVNGIIDNLPKIIEMGITLIIKLAEGLMKALPQLIAKTPQIIAGIVNGLSSGLGSIVEVGSNIMQGLWNGIAGLKDWVINKVKSLGKSILNGLKDALGIHSPSYLFRDQVGKNIVLGVAEGIEKNQKYVASAMNTMQNSLLGSNVDVNYTARINDAQTNDIASAVSTGIAVANTGSMPSTINVVVELGGTKVGEQIVKLYDRNKLALG